LAALKTAAAARLTAGVEPGTLPITSSPMSHLWDALCAAYRVLRFESAIKGDNVFRDLALSRIIEPTSKVDASRVLTEVGVKSFRMSKHDLQARPIYHHKRESIDAHLTTVFAALAVTHWIEHQTGWSIKKFVRTARRYRTVKIKAGSQILAAADPTSSAKPSPRSAAAFEHQIEPSQVTVGARAIPVPNQRKPAVPQQFSRRAPACFRWAAR